ncbi:phosphopantetheine-binding protein [Actibacterium pelagium]|uniref:Carrier domain-containing protein n=1 Tax=Actibacterium pelagium TaxID=2029103 RepID=A0A917EJX2_9RHOB|nr:phosphopantetheine-binding protein [Actibacterium pelagium]GGE45397.1 hypothetical protein GCM10011517_11260 [Actibacterium pelagium]
MNETAKALYEILSDYAANLVEPSSGVATAAFLKTHLEDLSLDSLDVLEVVMAIENRFEIALDEDEVAMTKVVGDFAVMVDRLSAAA